MTSEMISRAWLLLVIGNTWGTARLEKASKGLMNTQTEKNPNPCQPLVSRSRIGSLSVLRIYPQVHGSFQLESIKKHPKSGLFASFFATCQGKSALPPFDRYIQSFGYQSWHSKKEVAKKISKYNILGFQLGFSSIVITMHLSGTRDPKSLRFPHFLTQRGWTGCTENCKLREQLSRLKFKGGLLVVCDLRNGPRSKRKIARFLPAAKKQTAQLSAKGWHIKIIKIARQRPKPWRHPRLVEKTPVFKHRCSSVVTSTCIIIIKKCAVLQWDDDILHKSS